MRVSRWIAVSTFAVAGCATAVSTNVRPPLSAALTPTAKTGEPVPLRRDPTARVILSNASGPALMSPRPWSNDHSCGEASGACAPRTDGSDRP